MSNTGRHFELGDDLRVKTIQSHGTQSTGLSEDASRKHIATYSQPVQGPVELSTFQAMAQNVHDSRALAGQKKPPVNTVAIFNESALPPPSVTGKRGQFHELDVTSGTVFNSSKSGPPPVFESGAKNLTFAKNNNDHLEKIGK